MPRGNRSNAATHFKANGTEVWRRCPEHGTPPVGLRRTRGRPEEAFHEPAARAYGALSRRTPHDRLQNYPHVRNTRHRCIAAVARLELAIRRGTLRDWLDIAVCRPSLLRTK